MSAKLMGAVYGVELSHGQQAVLIAMADHGQDDGSDVFPSIGRLAWKTGYDKRQVKRLIKELRELEVLVEVAAATRRHPTEYRIDLAAATAKEPWGGNSAPRGDISDTSGVTPTPPKPSVDPPVQPKPPSTPPPASVVKSQLTEEIEAVWARQVEQLKPRARELQPDDRKIIREALKVGTVAELCTAIDTCAASDFHCKRGKHKNRKGGKHTSIAKTFKPRRGQPETWRSRLEWWLDLAEEMAEGNEPEFDMNAEADRVRQLQEAGSA